MVVGGEEGRLDGVCDGLFVEATVITDTSVGFVDGCVLGKPTGRSEGVVVEG